MASMTPVIVPPQAPTHLTRQPHPAGFFSRFEAFVIDLVILSIIQLVSSAFIQTILRFFRLTGLISRIQAFLDNSTLDIAVGSAVFALFVIGYFVFFWTLVGYTPGKAILGIKVMKMNGAKLSFGRSLLRFFCYWISAIPIFLGFLWVLWDPKRRAWHDKIAGTQVLYIPKKAHK
jgi:uncharacterized RDD family membrane protein YckC